jgi:predicted XRE-type DNA-binding protein
MEKQHLSNLNGATEEDLQVVSAKMKEYISTESEAVLEVIKDKLNERPGLIGALFPSKVKKEHDKLTIQKMKNLFDARENMLAVYTNTQIELARKAGDKMIDSKVMQYDEELIEQAMIMQKNLTSLAQININEMSEVFKNSRESFSDRRIEQLVKFEKIKDIDPTGYGAQIKSLDSEQIIFMETIDDLLNGFKDSLKNKLKNTTIS